MIVNKLTLLRNSQRSAVALIFGLCLVPLMYLIGFAVDYTFYSQARSQMLLAAEASATHAVRVALSTYTLELNNGTVAGNATTSGTAIYDANQAGEQAGAQWFQAQLGTLPRGSISTTPITGNPSTSLPNVTVTQPTSGGGFVANVSYGGTYPPLFNGLFARTSAWTYPGNSQATATFDYAEILFLLDTSNSMLIGTNANDEVTLEENSVCQGTTVWDPASNTNSGRDPMSFYDYGTSSNGGGSDNDAVDFTKVQHYLDPSGTTGTAAMNDDTGTCLSGYRWPTNNSSAYAPCALACHTSQLTATDGYTLDQYGEARRLRDEELGNSPKSGSTFADNGKSQFTSSGITYAASPYTTPTATVEPALSLRIDVVMDAAYTAIGSMETAESFTGQFTAGVYNFTTDVSAIASGTANTSTTTVEATSLTAAQAAVKNLDYLQTPTETTLPAYYNSGARNTNFAASMQDLRNGTVMPNRTAIVGTTGSVAGPSTGNVAGSTGGAPLKFLFIITDGFQDDNDGTIGGMTSYTAETTASYPTYVDSKGISSVCKQYKDLGFTVYVLAINYLPLASTNYYTNINFSDIYTAEDFGSGASGSYFSTNGGVAPFRLATTYSTRTLTTPPYASTNGPLQVGLIACATSYSDFKTATSGADITNAVQSLLRSALASTIRVSG
jgi:Flp pilus assembly protein TadG